MIKLLLILLPTSNFPPPPLRLYKLETGEYEQSVEQVEGDSIVKLGLVHLQVLHNESAKCFQLGES